MARADQEGHRLEALKRYESLQIRGDSAIAAITGLAADMLQVSQSALGFINRNHIDVVASSGIDIERLDLHFDPLDKAIKEKKIWHVRDAASNSDGKELPLIPGVDTFRFFAAAPLITQDGHAVAVLLVMDQAVREIGQDEIGLLGKLSAILMDQLELRLKAAKVEHLEREHRLLDGQLKRANKSLEESEERFRDLFDEAPIAYVHEDLQSRFIRANRTAIRTLGLKPEEVVGFVGKSLAPDEPEAQHRIVEALEHIGKGSVARGLVLELRRKDTGEPVWIEWWSRPAPDGSYTRTMFLDITDRVLLARENIELEAQNRYLKEEVRGTHFDEIVGDNAKMRQVFSDVDQVAPTTATVLVLGETGTGKELIARAVHNASNRADKPLIKVNCSALPSSLIESELFGHSKGAFTGATEKRSGRFLLADGGSIFLDEIGDLPIELQAKLLRVLQEGEFEPLGSSQTIHVDVRVIAATNRDLFEATQKGEFREDLYFRLAVFPILLPPLRDRLDDLPRLAALFARKFAAKVRREAVTLTNEEIDRLNAYSWPGNVRELQNVIERALITSRNGALNLDRALPETDSRNARSGAASGSRKIQTVKQLQQMEYDNLLLALETANWQVSGKGGAAELLAMNPTTLASRMKALGISRPV